jgi:hypothetical protein
MVAARGRRAKDYVQSVNFTAPLPEHPITDAPPGTSNDEHHDKRTDGEQQQHDKKTADASNTPADSQSSRDVKTDIPPQPASSEPDGSGPHDGRTDVPRVPLQNGVPPLPAPSRIPSTPATEMGAAGGAGPGSGAGGLTSGLGSALRPPSSSMGSVTGAGAATSPASAMPRVPSTPSSAAVSPLANAGSSFSLGWRLAWALRVTWPQPCRRSSRCSPLYLSSRRSRHRDRVSARLAYRQRERASRALVMRRSPVGMLRVVVRRPGLARAVDRR